MLTTFRKKIIRDFWINRGRTLLVVLSLTVGLFAVGTVTGAQLTLSEVMQANVDATHPSSVVFYTSHIDEKTAADLAARPEVALVEQRERLSVRVEVGPGNWRNLILLAAPDFNSQQLDLISPVQGSWPLAEGQVVIEQASMDFLGASLGSTLTIQDASGARRQLTVAGVAHDISQIRPEIAASAAGFISLQTLSQISSSPNTDLHVLLSPELTQPGQIRQASGALRLALESQGVNVFSVQVNTAGQHPLTTLVRSVTLVMAIMGLLALLLSAVLAANTISALLEEHTRQIGILKAVGARRGLIFRHYAGLVVLMSAVALAISIPLGALGAWALSGLIANLINLDMGPFYYPYPAVWLQIVAGGVVPLGAGLLPIWRAARQTACQAINNYGINPSLNRGLHFSLLWTRVPVSVRMAGRNILRRPARLALTLSTLTLASMVAMAVLSVQASTQKTVEAINQFFTFSAYFQFTRPSPITQIEPAFYGRPDLQAVEYWGLNVATPHLSGADPLANVALWAVPADSQIVHPQMVAGRWLEVGDIDTVVVDTYLVEKYPSVQIGGTLPLLIEGREYTWQVVGIYQSVPNRINPQPMAFVTFEGYTGLTGQTGLAWQVWVLGPQSDSASQAQLAGELDSSLKAQGLSTSWAVTGQELSRSFTTAFGILTALLMLMVILLSGIGAIGLTGMLSLGVLERQREMGVLRAIGAGRRAIQAMLAIESTLTCLAAWAMGACAAFPLSILLCGIVGRAFLGRPFEQVFSPAGVLIWLVIMLGTGWLACLLPSGRAARQPIAAALRYE
jgi:putative ABC transport system permease protein